LAIAALPLAAALKAVDPRAVGFNLQAQIAGPKGRRPSDAKGGGEAADRGAEGDEGPSRPASPEA